MEDWTEACDILHCNPNFHLHEWYDCVIINDDSPGTSVARLCSLSQCWLPSGKVIDVALVHAFTWNSWKPYTMWKNCQISEEARDSSFVLLDYVIRGALLCPVFDFDARLHYIVDTVDGNMFLRVNNLSWYNNIVVNTRCNLSDTSHTKNGITSVFRYDIPSPPSWTELVRGTRDDVSW